MALKLHSHAEQVADYLRCELARGRWAESMPGALALKAELGTSSNTIEIALKQLEAEGLLLCKGKGKRRQILTKENLPPKSLRVAILLYESDDRKVEYLIDLLYQLREAGHNAFFASKSLLELKMNEVKAAKFVDENNADAWIVVAGSRPVLQWFSAQPFPSFGLFGRIADVPIASTRPNKIPALRHAVQRLVSLGHQRIVLFTRRVRPDALPTFLEQAFLDELSAQGIATGAYNLPNWEETRTGFRREIDSLFQCTPPTALFLDTSLVTTATLQNFARLGIQVPRDVSLVCLDPDPVYALCDPVMSHIAYDSRPWLRHVLRWANNVARGIDDRKKSSPLAKFVEGGTIGPAQAQK